MKVKIYYIWPGIPHIANSSFTCGPEQNLSSWLPWYVVGRCGAFRAGYVPRNQFSFREPLSRDDGFLSNEWSVNILGTLLERKVRNHALRIRRESLNGRLVRK